MKRGSDIGIHNQGEGNTSTGLLLCTVVVVKEQTRDGNLITNERSHVSYRRYLFDEGDPCKGEACPIRDIRDHSVGYNSRSS